MPRFARKKDGTHEMVADAFRQAGWSVVDTYRAPECPDFFAAHDGRTVAVEVKSKGGTLTPAQQAFRDTWQGEYYVLTTPESVAQIILTPGQTEGGAVMAECEWRADEDGTYETTCGQAFQFFDGGPVDNSMKFCCYCGLALKDTPYQEPIDDSDEP